MKAMILAAGRGERMRPLTDTLPKPLLPVNGKPLIVYHIEKLKAAGITELVVNYAWLGLKIEETIGDGAQYGVHIAYSPEIPGGLETAGGIKHALPLLGTEPFVVVNGDVYTEYDYQKLPQIDLGTALGFLVLVKNPAHHLGGDFSLSAQGLVTIKPEFTFSGLAVYRPEAFSSVPDERAPLRPYFEEWINKGALKGEVMHDYWCDVGTPERLALVSARVKAQNNS